MSKPNPDLSHYVEDVRVTVRNENATNTMTAFPADVRTKEWITARQKESITTRGATVAPSELQWCSLGSLEFMEVDGRIWTEKPRKNQIIFHISMLTPDHVDALRLKIQLKHSATIYREQIQPVAIVDFHACIEITMDRVRRVFYGHVKNTAAIQPMDCVFEFNSSSDMQLVLDELNSEDGATLTCQVCVGGLKFEKTSLAVPKQRVVDANVGLQAFGDNADYALFTSSQLDEFAQMFVNVITIPEMTSSGGNLVGVKPLVMTALQPTLMEVMLTHEILAKLSPINGEQELLLQQLQQFQLTEGNVSEEGAEHITGEVGGGGSETRSHSHSPSRAAEKHKVTFSSGNKQSAKSTSKEVSSGDSAGYQSPRLSPRGVRSEGSVISGSAGTKARGHKHKHAPPPTQLYRVQRSRLNENMTLQWHRLLNPQAALFPTIEIDTRNNISTYNPRPLRDQPRKVSNVTVVRLPLSAWVSFKEPSDSGKGPVDSYTVHAQPITEQPDDQGMISTGKETREQKYSRKTKISCAGNKGPICVSPLRSDVEYRFAVECFNASGASSITDPVFMTVRDNDYFSTIPLYAILPYSGPLDAIPANFRRLDGSVAGIPNLGAAFTMKTDVTSQPAVLPVAAITAAGTGGAKKGGPPWMGLIYIQRIE